MDLRIIVLSCAALALTSSVYGLETSRVAPNCALTAVGDARRYDIREFRGQVLYVDFWASWCSPCARSFPFLNTLHHELRDRGLQVLGINLDEKPEDAKHFLENHPADFAVAFDAQGRCPHDFGVMAMPSSYLVDRQGNIRHVHLGFRPGESEKLRDLVEQLLAESLAGQ
ncbi:MAG: TlpA family protein disulfide reductase [Gammaproteobacteria bacterium]